MRPTKIPDKNGNVWTIGGGHLMWERLENNGDWELVGNKCVHKLHIEVFNWLYELRDDDTTLIEKGTGTIVFNKTLKFYSWHLFYGLFVTNDNVLHWRDQYSVKVFDDFKDMGIKDCSGDDKFYVLTDNNDFYLCSIHGNWIGKCWVDLDVYGAAYDSESGTIIFSTSNEKTYCISQHNMIFTSPGKKAYFRHTPNGFTLSIDIAEKFEIPFLDLKPFGNRCSYKNANK